MDSSEYLTKLKKVAKNRLHNEILTQPKIPVQMDFYEYLMKLKACVRYFFQIFIFSSNDRSSKTMKNVFYFI